MNPAQRWIDIACFEMYTTQRELFRPREKRTRLRDARRKVCAGKAFHFAKMKGIELTARDLSAITHLSHAAIKSGINTPAPVREER